MEGSLSKIGPTAGPSLAPTTFPGSPYLLYQTFEPAGDQPEAIDKLVTG